jgi:SAM-dependent methyltransferase
MKKLIDTIKRIRSAVNRSLINADSNRFPSRKRLYPISSKFGFDRGTPIDRYWIEKFLYEHKDYIRGRVLEITDSKYTKMFGDGKVSISDVLDINLKNKDANIKGDLRNLKGKINNNTYDCIILTHVLGLIDDFPSAIRECKRILKKGGVLLFTGSSLGPVLPGNEPFWRFNAKTVKFIFEKHFKPKSLEIQTYGNKLAAQAFLDGLAQEDLTKKELELNDKRYPCIACAVIIK